MCSEKDRSLFVALLVFGACSLVHFAHNAEFVAVYPNFPASLSRGDVYLSWIVVSAVGLGGWLLVIRGYRMTGLAILVAYAALGLDSLGHYVLAPLSSHTFAMNATILLEVTAAALVLVEVTRRLAIEVTQRRTGHERRTGTG